MKKKKIYYTFRIHSEQLEYLRNKAKTEFTTVTPLTFLGEKKNSYQKKNNSKKNWSVCLSNNKIKFQAITLLLVMNDSDQECSKVMDSYRQKLSLKT